MPTIRPSANLRVADHLHGEETSRQSYETHLLALPQGTILRAAAHLLEAAMTRKYIDCRDFPNEANCTLAISGAEEEVLDAAVMHAASVHGHENTPELRESLRGLLKDAPEIVAAA
jgi:predicted small metal-binding protein